METSKYTYIWFNEPFNLNLKDLHAWATYEKDEDELKSHVFDILPKDYKYVWVSCNINISKMEFKDLKKDIHWFWKTELNGNKTQGETEPEDKVLTLNP